MGKTGGNLLYRKSSIKSLFWKIQNFYQIIYSKNFTKSGFRLFHPQDFIFIACKGNRNLTDFEIKNYFLNRLFYYMLPNYVSGTQNRMAGKNSERDTTADSDMLRATAPRRRENQKEKKTAINQAKP